MLIWFVACGVVLVALVLDSSGADYRFVALGSVAPLAEGATGAPWVLHTLAGSVLLLTLVMVATAGRGRKRLRRRLLGVPIGTLVFLVAAGVWQRAELFWWPFMGLSDGVGESGLPAFDRPWVVLVALELVGVAALLWVARTRGLADAALRRDLIRRGRLQPSRSGRAHRQVARGSGRGVGL